MRDAFAVFKETFFDWWNSMVGLALANVVWLIGLVSIIFMPPATAGLYYITHSMAQGMGQRGDDFIEGARKYLWISYRWFLINVVVGIVLYVNLVFYANNLEDTLFLIGFTFTAALTLLWIMMQFYTWPFLMFQEDKSLLLAFKNALLLALGAPAYNVVMLTIIAVLMLISILTLVPVAFFTIAFIALLGTRAVRERLKTYDKLPST